MGIAIREANLHRDRQHIMEILLRNRERYTADAAFAARYDWLYLQSPCGPATAWLAIDEKSGKAIGTTSAIPRKMFVNGEEVVAWNCADFSIDRAYRTLGVALKLRRAARQAVDRGQVAFLYAHPNDRMLVIHQKAGHHTIGQMQRFAAVLRLDCLFADRLRIKPLAALAAALANPALRFVARLPKAENPALRFQMTRLEAPGDEFDQLNLRFCQRHAVVGSRDAAYLRWRYGQNPVHSYAVLKMYMQDGLAGYCIFTRQENTAHLTDLVLPEPEHALAPLLGELLRRLRRDKICTASIKLHLANALLPALRALGFRPRHDATSTVATYAPEKAALAPAVLDPENWYMTAGDRDI